MLKPRLGIAMTRSSTPEKFLKTSYIAVCLASLPLISCTTTRSEGPLDPSKNAMEIPEFDADKWVSLPEATRCVAYLYQGSVAADGSVKDWKLLASSGEELFQTATEQSLAKWKAPTAKNETIYADIFYSRNGEAEIVMRSKSEAEAVASRRSKFAAYRLDERTKNADLKVISRKEPDYPKGLAYRNVDGVTYLSFDINDQGRTENIKILFESPKLLFADPSIAAIRKWQFEAGFPSKNREVRFDFKVPQYEKHDCYFLSNLDRSPTVEELKRWNKNRIVQ